MNFGQNSHHQKYNDQIFQRWCTNLWATSARSRKFLQVQSNICMCRDTGCIQIIITAHYTTGDSHKFGFISFLFFLSSANELWIREPIWRYTYNIIIYYNNYIMSIFTMISSSVKTIRWEIDFSSIRSPSDCRLILISRNRFRSDICVYLCLFWT